MAYTPDIETNSWIVDADTWNWLQAELARPARFLPELAALMESRPPWADSEPTSLLRGTE